jgi:hypothetical protein
MKFCLLVTTVVDGRSRLGCTLDWPRRWFCVARSVRAGTATRQPERQYSLANPHVGRHEKHPNRLGSTSVRTVINGLGQVATWQISRFLDDLRGFEIYSNDFRTFQTICAGLKTLADEKNRDIIPPCSSPDSGGWHLGDGMTFRLNGPHGVEAKNFDVRVHSMKEQRN